MDLGRFISVDNFFTDPFTIRDWALSLDFFEAHSHPFPDSVAYFPGVRTNFLQHHNKGFFDRTARNLLSASNILTGCRTPWEDIVSWTCYLSFSQTFSWMEHTHDWHTDFDSTIDPREVQVGGICYLSPDPPNDCGTLIRDGFGREFAAGNVFNRLVLFNASSEHRIQRSFGEDPSSSRLVMTVKISVLTQ